MSLNAVFSNTPHASKSAQDIFTDRKDQAKAFEESIRRVRESTQDGAMISDLAAPRWNVLAYYGMGGIGKTTLADELRRRFLDKAFGGADGSVAAVTFDFKAGHDRGFEELLLRARAAVGPLGTWSAFDLAFAGYWEQRHPGVPLNAIGDQFSKVRKVGDAWGVGDQIQASVEAVLNSATFGLVGVGRRLGTIAVRHVLETAKERRLLEDCPLFDKITAEPDLDQMAAYLPHLLAWDLHKIQLDGHRRQQPVDVVVFVDTWEELQRTSSGKDSLEDLVSRFAYLMPNVLFVVLGRDRLDWSEDHKRATMTFAGVRCWPGLIDGCDREPTQHLLGGLAPDDREWFLANCREIDGAPAIPAVIRDEINRASDGLPFYLDLAADYFDEISSRGEVPRPEDFRVAFPELVGRVMRDLPPAERNLLAAAAVAGSFDRRLLADLVPQILPSDLDRFLTRNLVQGPSSDWLPYRLHDRLRESVAAYRDQREGCWSDAHWQDARVQASNWIVAEQLAEHSNNSTGPATRARALVLAAELIARSAVTPSGFPLLLWKVEQAGDLSSLLEVLGRLSACTDPDVRALSVATKAGARSAMNAEDLPSEILSVLESAGDEQTRDLLNLYLGAVQYLRGNLPAAEHAYASVSTRTPEFAAAVARTVAGLLLRRSRFKEAMASACGLERPDDRAVAAVDDLQGLILFHAGRFADAVTTLTSATAAAERAGLPLWQARSSRHAYLAGTWGNFDTDPALLTESTELNTAVGSPIGLAQLESAMAIVRARKGEPWLDLIESASSQCATAGSKADLLMIQAARVACEMLTGDVDGARRTHMGVLELWRSLETGPLWPAVTAILCEVPTDLPQPQWLDDATVAVRSWRGAILVPTRTT